MEHNYLESSEFSWLNLPPSSGAHRCELNTPGGISTPGAIVLDKQSGQTHFIRFKGAEVYWAEQARKKHRFCSNHTLTSRQSGNDRCPSQPYDISRVHLWLCGRWKQKQVNRVKELGRVQRSEKPGIKTLMESTAYLMWYKLVTVSERCTVHSITCWLFSFYYKNPRNLKK